MNNKIIWLSGANGFLGTNLLGSLNKNYQCNPILRVTYPQELKGDILIHCGWISASNSNDLNNPNQIDNITESIKLFHRGISGGIKHFVFISTSWVYGKLLGIDNLDEEWICEPNNLYGFSKLKVEEIWAELAKINNVKLTIVRPFWIYGEKDKENRFIPSLINKCLKNQDISLNPCLHEVDYLNISDFCESVQILIDKQAIGVYNVCGGYEFRIKDIIRIIFEKTKSSSRLFYDKEYPPGFIQKWVGSNEKLKNLGWKPKIDIDKGLEETVNYYRNKI